MARRIYKAVNAVLRRGVLLLTMLTTLHEDRQDREAKRAKGRDVKFG